MAASQSRAVVQSWLKKIVVAWSRATALSLWKCGFEATEMQAKDCDRAMACGCRLRLEVALLLPTVALTLATELLLQTVVVAVEL